MLAPITFPVIDGREFILTLNGKPVMVPVEPVKTFVEGCCPWMDGITGFANACPSCKAGFG
jgi:hypothetical protein